MAADPAMSAGWPDPVRLGALSRGPVRLAFVADEAGLKRIAGALDLVDVERLEATATVSQWLDGAELTARWRATVVQACVVTLDPLAADLEGDFTVRLAPAGSDAAPTEGGEITVDPDAEDPPDVLEGDAVDVGAYVIEHLALALDPFPRTPGAEFQPPEPVEPPSPFAVLLQLKDPKAGR